MRTILLGGLILLGVSGCITTVEPTPKANNDNLPVVDGALLAKEWQELNRFPPRFPTSHAIKGEDGCATLEYVISADNTISNIQVIDATSKQFAKQARLNVKKWHWSALPKGITKTPIKTQTQFQYCLDSGDGRCKKKPKLAQCSGDDVIYSVGYRVKKR